MYIVHIIGYEMRKTFPDFFNNQTYDGTTVGKQICI